MVKRSLFPAGIDLKGNKRKHPQSKKKKRKRVFSATVSSKTQSSLVTEGEKTILLLCVKLEFTSFKIRRLIHYLLH